MHKMVSRKATKMRVLDNTPVMAHIQLQPRKGASSVVEHSFDMYMYNNHMHCMVYELCMIKEKEG